MKNLDLRLQDLISQELEKLKRKRPFVTDVEVQYEHQHGRFYSKLKAKTRKKSVFLSQKSECAETGIRKMFNNLKRKLAKKSHNKGRRLNFDLKEVA